MFDAQMYADAEKWVSKMLRCPDLIAVAIVIVWYRWSMRPDVPLRQHAYYAALQARRGRDLPDVKRPAKDLWYMGMTQAGSMAGLADGKPGPVKVAEWNEQWERFWQGLDERERDMADLYIDGAKNQDVAERMGISPGRATQIRQKMMEHLE